MIDERRSPGLVPCASTKCCHRTVHSHALTTMPCAISIRILLHVPLRAASIRFISSETEHIQPTITLALIAPTMNLWVC